MQEKIAQTSGANSEDKHSKIARFLTLNKQIITYSLQHHSSSLFWFRIQSSLVFNLFLTVNSKDSGQYHRVAFNSNGPTTYTCKYNTNRNM